MIIVSDKKKSNLRMINYLLKHIDPKESESFHTNSPRTLSMTISGFDEKKKVTLNCFMKICQISDALAAAKHHNF